MLPNMRAMLEALKRMIRLITVSTIGKNGMLRVKMFETVDIGPVVILPVQNLLSDFAEGHTRQNRRSRNAPLPEYEVSYPNGN